MLTLAEAVPVKDLKSGVKPIWCPGCGDYGVMNATLKAISELKIDPAHIAIASGIGCSGRFPAFVKTYGFHGVHGRALPLATGIKLANPDLTVFAMSGDGDGFSIGAGHLPHAARRNVDITYLVMDNEIYGLTKGQPSPTSPEGMEKKAAPYGTTDRALNPMAMMLAYGTTFVARGFSARPQELAEIITQGILHPGFAFIEVFSPCVTFNDTYAHFKQTTAPIPDAHDRSNRLAALALALDPETDYLGIFYQDDRTVAHHTALKEIRDRAAGSYSLPTLIDRFRR
jgi:2-oxoglutarate ferredoxin oxidoreductase subunit beta